MLAEMFVCVCVIFSPCIYIYPVVIESLVSKYLV